jgi:Ni,Fe-hydrogenase III small subunit
MMWPVIRQISKVGIRTEKAPIAQDLFAVDRIHNEILRILGRALTIREVDAGSCNGCEPDMLLVTGPVSRNMSQALAVTEEAMPAPKLVVAVGDCAINGGIFGHSYATLGGVSEVLTVDLAIPGCPPEPIVILEGILTAVRYRLEKGSG